MNNENTPTLEQAADQATPVTPEVPDTTPEAEAIELEGVGLSYVDGIFEALGTIQSGANKGKPYGRIRPTQAGMAVAVIHGLPLGRKTGVAVGTMARWYVLPQNGNNFTYAGHDLIAKTSIRTGAKAADLQSKADATKAIAVREKAKAKTAVAAGSSGGLDV